MKLIVGLGNPGAEYFATRHNVGFMFIDFLIKKLNLETRWQKKFNSSYTKTKINGAEYLLQLPETFMNNSGEAVGALTKFYKIKPADILVIHDDVDIILGKYKIQTDRSSAGHHGVESIISHLRTQTFTRLRIGVKTEKLEKIPTDKFVLQEFNKEEVEIINQVFEEIINKKIIK